MEYTNVWPIIMLQTTQHILGVPLQISSSVLRSGHHVMHSIAMRDLHPRLDGSSRGIVSHHLSLIIDPILYSSGWGSRLEKVDEILDHVPADIVFQLDQSGKHSSHMQEQGIRRSRASYLSDRMDHIKGHVIQMVISLSPDDSQRLQATGPARWMVVYRLSCMLDLLTKDTILPVRTMDM